MGVSCACGTTITLVLLLMLIDPNTYRSQLEWGASTAFGRQVQFEGPIAIEPSLQPRVVIGGFKVSNPGWASRPYMAEVEQVAVRANLLSLLRGKSYFSVFILSPKSLFSVGFS